MTGASGPRILLWICVWTVATAAGCADLDILPSWMPFQGPRSDRLPNVVTPAERIAELKSLASRASQSSPEERQRVSQQLAHSIRAEKDPLIRAEIVRALGGCSGSTADAVLKAALSDTEARVRIAACEAWGTRGDAAAVQLLSETLRSDVDADVRLAAAKALGNAKGPEAVAALGEALADADPAMQYRAVLSLERVTGKDMGNSVERWQQYVKGEQPEPAPSLAERLHLPF